MSEHPREGWAYPIVERCEPMDGGDKIGAVLIDADGGKRALRWKLADIERLATITITLSDRRHAP